MKNHLNITNGNNSDEDDENESALQTIIFTPVQFMYDSGSDDES